MRSARLHDGELDPLLGADLTGTPAQSEREEDVLRRFAFFFGLFSAVGLVIDLSGLIGDVGMAATMALGSIGVLAGTVAVLCADHRPLDHALTDAERAMGDGVSLLTVPFDDGSREAATRTVARHGGTTVFEA